MSIHLSMNQIRRDIVRTYWDRGVEPNAAYFVRTYGWHLGQARRAIAQARVMDVVVDGHLTSYAHPEGDYKVSRNGNPEYWENAALMRRKSIVTQAMNYAEITSSALTNPNATVVQEAIADDAQQLAAAVQASKDRLERELRRLAAATAAAVAAAAPPTTP